jgi:hypothetical protein
VNVSENSTRRHSRTPRDFGGFEVWLQRRKGEDDIDQLGARSTSQRPIDLFSIFSGQIHSVRQL